MRLPADAQGEGFEFPFTGEKAKCRLVNGALYPMLAAFRGMIEDNPKNGAVRWRGGFKSVLRRWEESAAELMRMTAQASTELGRNPNAIGKSKNHWANLHARINREIRLAGLSGNPATAL
jgi:hypothetical protein